MEFDEFTRLQKKLFLEGLEKKTGWGKNEIKELYNVTLAQALAEALVVSIRNIQNKNK